MKRNIRGKLLALFFTLAVAPMVVVGVVSYFNSVRSVEAVVKQRTMATAQEVATDVRRLFSLRQNEVKLLTRNREIQDLYARYAIEGFAAVDLMAPQIETFFRQFFTGPREGFAQVYYLDLEGALLFQYARGTGAALALERYTPLPGRTRFSLESI